MPWDSFVEYFKASATAIDLDFKHKLINVDANRRYTRYTIDNPVSQYVYISADIYAWRNYPRAKKCFAKPNLITRLYDAKKRLRRGNGLFDYPTN